MAKKPTIVKVKPYKSGPDVLTNEIEKFHIDYPYLDHRFDFYSIKIEITKDDDGYDKKVIEVSKKLHDSGKVLSTYHYKNAHAKFFMVDKGEVVDTVAAVKVKLQDSTYNWRRDGSDKKPLNQMEWVINSLLINAIIPLLTRNPENPAIVHEERIYIFTAGESFFTRESDTVPKTIIKTVGIQGGKDWGIARNDIYGNLMHKELPQVLNASTVTFTSTDYINILPEKNKYRKRLKSRQIFELDGKIVVPAKITEKGKKRPKEGVINSGIFKRGTVGRKKNRIGAYDITHDNRLEDSNPSVTRAGAMSTVMRYIDEVYKGNVRIELKKYHFETFYHTNDLGTAKDAEYQVIVDILRRYNIRVLNHTVPNKDRDEVVIDIEGMKKCTLERPSKEHKIDLEKLINITQLPKEEQADARNKLNNADKIEAKEKVRKTTGLTILLDSEKADVDRPEVVLLIVDEPDAYGDAPDPYKQYKCHNPDKIIQAITYDNLQKGGSIKNAIFECLLANILYKLEVKNGFFPEMMRPELPEGAWFIQPIRLDTPENEDDEGEIDGIFQYYKAGIVDGKPIYSALTDKEIRLIKDTMAEDADLLFGRKKKKQNKEDKDKFTKNRNPVLFYPDKKAAKCKYIAFAKTDRSALPSFELHEPEFEALKGGRSTKVNRTWFENYIVRNDALPKAAKAIQIMLDLEQERDEFDYTTYNAAMKKDLPGFGKPGNTEKYQVQDAVHNELGIRWRDTARLKDNFEYFAHQRGIGFSYSNKLYYAGQVGGAEYGEQSTFCSLYQMITNMTEIPPGLDRLLHSFSIRNKQTTVYPFIFKHIKEFAFKDLMNFEENEDRKQVIQPENKHETQLDYDDDEEFDEDAFKKLGLKL
ncbi:hypothetical protein A9Q81_02805 [Gammaproteobacteria bacterium 42_54_T18]|nr:hypothetical protein A9Q81_02805 [Gammaproteobacteria bacterium 42_54_T18]